MIDKQSRMLVLILAILVALAIWITIDQEAKAEYCCLEWRQYWSPWARRYVSYPVWCCGWGYNKRCQAACLNYYGGYGPCY